jgi:glycosyltransferase involved in cell wall biosynthesis
MIHSPEIRKIAFVGDYLPRKCGIATFTCDVRNSVATAYPDVDCIVTPVDDIEGGYDYPPEVRFEFPEQDLDSYRRLAHFLNISGVDVVCLQHEFGIYGGAAGSHVLTLLRELRMPAVTTLHTVLREPNQDQRRVMRQLAALSSRLVVMSQRGREFLEQIYEVSPEKIDVIHHGIPDMPFVDPNFYKDQFQVEGKQVLLTFGLLSPNKGIEHMIRAMPAILEQFPDTVYFVLGATHPNLVRDHGEGYRFGLERLAQELGVRKQVVFYNRFVDLPKLIEFLGCADVYVTPYLNPAQITSGTLAYSFGCGKAVVSTPYWHAEELLADGRGVLVPFGDSQALATEICGLLQDDSRRHAMRKRAYLMGREMIWSEVAQRYMESFLRARQTPRETAVRVSGAQLTDAREFHVPRLRFDHLLRMTDATGLLQHAVYDVPNFAEGYCTDDNSRALVLAVLLEELGHKAQRLDRIATTYAAFLRYAFNPVTGRFRNFMSFDRRWLEENGSDDSLGRAIWALGACVGRSERHGLQLSAVEMWEPALRSCVECSSPRAWALGIVGIHEYFRRMSGDRHAADARETLTTRLLDRYEATADDDWPWFEEILTYDNAKLPHALILSGRWTGNERALSVGLDSLRWLLAVQASPRGCFRPVGVHGFYRRGDEQAAFDQQPLEAHATVSACIEAHAATGDEFWLERARWAFEWFLGRNDLGLPLYDARTGGCRDGLLEDRVNGNQGAESTLAMMLSQAEMQLLEASLAASEQADKPQPAATLSSSANGEAAAGKSAPAPERLIVRGAAQ